jgi:hypothetical protein
MNILKYFVNLVNTLCSQLMLVLYPHQLLYVHIMNSTVKLLRNVYYFKFIVLCQVFIRTN